ncbi:MAG: hypothetical protein IPK97_14600 [Ahniella sp.]|nr:hypothetical protein [Ahniella sp.]
MSPNRRVTRTDLPPSSLLARYAGTGAYTDCYAVDVPGHVSLADFVHAFYTGFVFRIERWLLRVFLSRPSTDLDIARLMSGESSEFAAWRVEDRTDTQLLMCDIAARTRSWFMVEPSGAGGTRLYFGSAVVPKLDRRTGKTGLGFLFTALLGFHRIYSHVLLRAARKRI